MSNDYDIELEEIRKAFEENFDAFDLFLKNIKNFFESRKLSKNVHSIRHRIKNTDHFMEKVRRKNAEDLEKEPEHRIGPITRDNVFERITDIAGLRVLHLHTSQFEFIHNTLMEKIEDGEFVLHEQPKAYTWDPESGQYFERLGLQPQRKDSYYTSIHYVLRPNSRAKATCEVQIRTLLEEVWGEIDHTMNYPTPTTDDHCKEQIKILARLVGTGTHLADSIMRRYGNRE